MATSDFVETRGVDVGAIAEIHDAINKLVDEGVAVVVISSYLPEILRLSDRVLVARQGRIVEEFSADAATEESILYVRMCARATRLQRTRSASAANAALRGGIGTNAADTGSTRGRRQCHSGGAAGPCSVSPNRRGIVTRKPAARSSAA